MIDSKHWIELLAQRIVDEREPPFLVTAGMTTSGPFHMGTLCEMLFPNAIVKYLANQGHKTKFVFFADILDAFDSVPTSMQQFSEQLTPHLGKPLCDVPDPHGKANSFGEYFLEEARSIGESFGIHPEIKKINELYKQGLFDDYTRLYLREPAKSAEIVARTSLRDSLPTWWNPIMPVCENCGRIATTRVTEFDENSYSYIDDRDIGYTKGCGHSGSNKISDRRYKLTWRLHWPSWMQIFGPSTVEGAGVDHHTRGGSWDTVVAVHNEMLHKQPPIPYKFGFVLLQGKKYSKSKGIGMGVGDLLGLMPPQILAYSLLRPDVQENKNFDPTGQNLLILYEDYFGASQLNFSEELSRADRKRAIAYSLSTDKKLFSNPFSDYLIHYTLYRDWNKVAETLGDIEGTKAATPFIERWLEAGLLPEDYAFSFSPSRPEANVEAVGEFANALNEKMSPLDVHNLAFQTAKARGIEPAVLFKSLYHSLISKERGPKLGKLVCAIGVAKVKEALLSKTK